MAVLTQPGTGGNQLLVFKKMRLEDIGKDPKATMQYFAQVYNQFGQTVYNLLNGQLTLQTNVEGYIYKGTVTAPNNYVNGANTNFSQFTFGAGFSPVNNVICGGCRIANGQNAPEITPKWVSWVESSPGQVTVQYITGLLAGVQYNINLQVT